MDRNSVNYFKFLEIKKGEVRKVFMPFVLFLSLDSRSSSWINFLAFTQNRKNLDTRKKRDIPWRNLFFCLFWGSFSHFPAWCTCKLSYDWNLILTFAVRLFGLSRTLSTREEEKMIESCWKLHLPAGLKVEWKSQESIKNWKVKLICESEKTLKV